LKKHQSNFIFSEKESAVSLSLFPSFLSFVSPASSTPLRERERVRERDRLSDEPASREEEREREKSEREKRGEEKEAIDLERPLLGQTPSAQKP